MPDTYPTDQDLKSFLYAASLIDSESAPTGRYAALDYQGAVDAARAEFERRTGRIFVAASATEFFDPVTLRNGMLALDSEWSTIDEVEVDGTVLNLNTDYYLTPYSGPPYRHLQFLTVTTAPVPWGSQATVAITGTRGFGEVPADVFQAILQRAASVLMPSIVGVLTSGMAAAGVASLRLGDADVAFRGASAGAAGQGSMGSGWDALFERTVGSYRMARLI